MIYQKHPFLGASTDGIVHENNNNVGLIEIKKFLQKHYNDQG